MTTVFYDMTGTDGTTPSGVTDISTGAADASIQTNRLRLSAGAGDTAAALIDAIDYDTSAELWHEWTFEIGTTAGFATMAVIANAALTDLFTVSIAPVDSTIRILDEASVPLVTSVALSDTVSVSQLWHLRAHVIYGGSGVIEAWAWLDGDPAPSWTDTPLISFSGSNTVSGGSGADVIPLMVGGTGREHWLDSLTITDESPLPHPAVASSNTQQGTNLSTAANLTLPSGAASGDLVLYFISSDNTGGTAITASTGWTEILSSTITSNVHGGKVFARVLDGTTGDNILNPNGAAQDYTAIGVRIASGDHPWTTSSNLATAFASLAAITNSASNGSPDPPNLSPGSSNDYLWLAWGVIDKSASGNSISANPSNHTLVQTSDSAASTTSSYARLTYRKTTAGSEDPGTMTSTSRPWIAATIAIPPPSFDGIATPAVLALTASLPAATVTGGAVAVPAALALTAVLPAPSASGGGGDGTATPSVLPLTAVLPAPSVLGGALATPAALPLAAALPAASAIGGALATPSVLPLTAVLPAATALGGAVAVPAALSLAAVLPAASAIGGALASPSALSLAAVLPADSALGGAIASPAVLALVVVAPTPSASGGGGTDGTATPPVLALTTVLPAATAFGGALATPAPLALAAVLPAASAIGGAIATPAVLALAAVLPAATALGGAVATPAALARSVVLPSPTVLGGAVASGLPLALLVGMPIPAAVGGAIATPAVLACVVSLPQPTVIVVNGVLVLTGAPIRLIPLDPRRAVAVIEVLRLLRVRSDRRSLEVM